MAGKWVPVVPIPDDAPARPVAHIVRGKPESVFDFAQHDGLIGHLFRFRRSNGETLDVALTYCVHEVTNQLEWRWVSFPTPRKLYGPWKLHWMKEQQNAIILCDDPAAVDAGMKADLPFRLCAWPGGPKALTKMDWSQLDAQMVLLWPTVDHDADQPKLRAMKQLATQLVKRGCTVKLMDTAGQPEGWNLASAIADGWDGADLLSWISEHAALIFSRKVFEQDAKGISTPKVARAETPVQRSWRERLELVMRKGELTDCKENVIEFLLHHPAWKGVLAWDEFGHKVVKRKPPPWGGDLGEFTEDDFIRLGRWTVKEEDLLIRATGTLEQAVVFVARLSTYHPVRELIKSQVWDGTPRLDSFISDVYDTPQREYTQLVGRYFFINLIRRVFEPGCTMRTVLVAVGKQNKGKSEVFAIIGGEWFADTHFNVGEKDSYQQLHGKWIYEIAEFHSFGKAEANKVKAFVSSKTDNFRASYGRKTKDWPRQICFVASTNQYSFLNDPTGNSRFTPIRHGAINLGFVRENRLQLLAEAYQAYLAGEKAYPEEDLYLRVFRPEEELYEIDEPWRDMIIEFIVSRGKERVTMNSILVDCLKFEPSKFSGASGEVKRVASILQSLGCERDRETSGARAWFYWVPKSLLDGTFHQPPSKTGTNDDEF